MPQTSARLKPFLERFGSRQIGTLTPANLEAYKKDLAFYPVNIHKLRYAVNITIRRSRKKRMLDNNDKPARQVFSPGSSPLTYRSDRAPHGEPAYAPAWR